MSLYSSGTSKPEQPPAVTEFDILRASHKFLRDDTAADGSSTSWNDQLARKYYDTLYREFAICDLKHFKSGNFALRWRTESEVLAGTGETSCANTRCEHHHPPSALKADLSTLELPFAYEEHGEHREALVKVVLCPKCVRKLMWKRRRDKRLDKGVVKEGVPAATNEPTSSAERRPRRSRSRSPHRRAQALR